mmetsp:Transcript_20645/g.47688  ORF Transcript_20645/g.47688 Transcript_20645/m.47688 type:complete len:202 (-) Transcript_20645:478-1083(-)
MFLGEHLWGAVSSEHDANVLTNTRRTREKLRSIVDKHHRRVENGSSNNRSNHVSSELKPANVVVGKGDDENVLRITSHGQSRPNVGGGGKGKKVGDGVGDLVSDTKINDNTREDENNGVVHHGSGSDGGHRHDLGRTLPVHRIIKGITELVKQTSTFHLFEVNCGKHKTKKKEERFHDNHTLGIKKGAVTSFLETETPDNH